MNKLALLLFATGACSKVAAPSSAGVEPPAASIAGHTSVDASSRSTDRFETAKGPLDVTPLNHASVLFEWSGQAIYVDPTVVAVADAALPKADIVFITDIHPDHLDGAALERLRKEGTLVVAPPAVADQAHVDAVMKNGDTRDVRGIAVTAVPMYNLTRGPAPGKLYHDKGRGNGYVLDFAGMRVYLSGDTECTPEMRGLERIDVAFVCMNLPYTMPPSEARECIEAFRPKVLFPYHYRGSDLGELRSLTGRGIEVRERTWY